MTDSTNDPARRSWVLGADGDASFPIQNLPFGIFAPNGEGPRGGVAIGDMIFDIRAGLGERLFPGESGEAAELAAGTNLNRLMAAGPAARKALRNRISEILTVGHEAENRAGYLLHRASRCQLMLPAHVPNYSDFFAGINHATNAGMLNRPGTPPLGANYKYVPVGYHSRASSVRPSGHEVIRPAGQLQPKEAGNPPDVGPTQELDIELELGMWIGQGNALGKPVSIGQARDHIFGYCLLNDWSSRDIQRWESAPLGPFLGKSFMTSVSPWIVTPEALAPFRKAQPPRPAGDPAPLPYLLDPTDQAEGAIDISIDILIRSKAMAEKGIAHTRVARCTTMDLYWTMTQLVAHQTVNGCNMEPGDLFGSGTISGPSPDALACFMELSKRGREPFSIGNDESRAWLDDGDEVIFRGSCSRDGFASIGFGECRGTVVAAA